MSLEAQGGLSRQETVRQQMGGHLGPQRGQIVLVFRKRHLLRQSTILRLTGSRCARIAGLEVEGNALVRFKRPQARALDGGVMYENIAAMVIVDEAIAAFGIIKFHNSYRHIYISISIFWMNKPKDAIQLCCKRHK